MEKAAILRWETSQEINSSHFEVEKSLDAISFTAPKELLLQVMQAFPPNTALLTTILKTV
jgi:hypothetical protein